MTARRTIVVHTTLSGHMIRVDAARSGASGVQVMTMAQLASRLAGGFLRPIDAEELQEAVRAALASSSLGELDVIKNLPGMVRAAVSTLDKVWRADIDLSTATNPRLTALHTLENETLRRLPPSMKRPRDLVELACSRIRHAPAVIGPVEIHGHSEMSPCWRPLLAALTTTVPVAWVAGARSAPSWLDELKIDVRRETPNDPELHLLSCATPHHEALEAFRWMRELIASGKARPEEIAIAAASPADFDDHMMALSADANIPIHFVHGVKAVTTRDGQTAAALAEALIKGVSQERVTRLFALLHDASKAIADLPRDWTRVLPQEAPLTTVERWEQAFAQSDASDWPDGVDRSNIVLSVLRLLEKGSEAAVQAGEELLPSRSLGLWRRALADGPPEALPVTLTQLRVADGLEPASHVIWTSAISLASSPRPYVRLLAFNTGRWPRRISEDRLIPDHIIPLEELDPLPIADGDRRDYADDRRQRSLGRHLFQPTRCRRPPSRALASHRRSVRDLSQSGPHARACGQRSRSTAWRDRPNSRRRRSPSPGSDAGAIGSKPEITAHDGLVGRAHPRLRKVFDRPMSATSLKLLLRDPIRFAWRYALGWKQPDAGRRAAHARPARFRQPRSWRPGTGGEYPRGERRFRTRRSEPRSSRPSPRPRLRSQIHGRGSSRSRRRSSGAAPWRGPSKSRWPRSLILWSRCPRQKSWTEIPFGTRDAASRNDLPWDPTRKVDIPGAGVFIQGHIDRLDLSGDGSRARVIDYKTGKPRAKMAEIVIEGGGELQRCLYAFAVKTLLDHDIEVDAALLYPRATEGDQALFPLQDVDATLERLAAAIALARRNIEAGLALPGIDANDDYNDFAFALPGLRRLLCRARWPWPRKSSATPRTSGRRRDG